MVNDMLGMKDNKVSLGHIAEVSEDMKMAVLGHQDDFFRQHMCATNRPALQNSNTLSMYNDWGTVARDVLPSTPHITTLFPCLIMLLLVRCTHPSTTCAARRSRPRPPWLAAAAAAPRTSPPSKK